MPAPKLFLYKARDAPVAVILRRGEHRSLWEMIRWDQETDTFTRGQWLTVAQQMNGSYCAISPDGRHFAYWYSDHKPNFTTHAVISEVPYFTALFYTEEHASNWDTIAFNAAGQPMSTRGPSVLKKRKPTTLEPAAWEKGVHSGFATEFVDVRGRHITTDKGRLLANGQLLYDTTDHVFTELKYVAGQKLPTETMGEAWEPAAAEPPRRSARLAAKARSAA